MNIDKFKHQHLDILRSIDLLRQLTHAGVERNAAEIAQRIVAMSSTIKLHLAVEDQALYPALQRSGNASLARMGRQYQRDIVKATWARSPAPTTPLRAAGTRPKACAPTRRASAPKPTWCCARCTNACSAKTAISTPASRSKRPCTPDSAAPARLAVAGLWAGFFYPCLPVRLCFIKLPIVFGGYRGHHR